MLTGGSGALSGGTGRGGFEGGALPNDAQLNPAEVAPEQGPSVLYPVAVKGRPGLLMWPDWSCLYMPNSEGWRLQSCLPANSVSSEYGVQGMHAALQECVFVGN